MMRRGLLGGASALALVFALSGCGGSGATSDANSAASAQGTFTFAPSVGKKYTHRMTRYDEFAVLGAPVRQSEEWIIDWEVEVQKEANNYKTINRLVGLQIKANGQALLAGDEVAAKEASLEILLDKDANISDIRGTETLTQVLVDLAVPEAKEAVRAQFSPQQLKALFFQRVQERTRDLVGRPAEVGASWISNEGVGGVVPTKQLKVTGQEDCGDRVCLVVARQYDVDKQAVWAIAEARVAAWVKSQGGEPGVLQVASAEVKLEDQLVVDPGTMEFHRAGFDQQANLRVGGYQGELEVQVLSKRESTYKY